jgi:hypothetical protein
LFKFGRNYRLRISDEETGDAVTITLPITIKFTVQRYTGSTLNIIKADIYNLSENVRNFLFQEKWSDRRKRIVFEGGYDTLSTLYIGELWTGNSYRSGSDIITSIEGRSSVWELDNSTVYTTLNNANTVGDVISFLAGQFKDTIPVGAIGDWPEQLLRPVTLNGNTWNLLKQYSDGTAFVDNGKIFVLRRNETIDGDLLTITQDSGLLSTPVRRDLNIQVNILFEPRIVMNQEITLAIQNTQFLSGVGSVYNGTYKVFGIQHQGTISEAENGTCITTIELYAGGIEFKSVGQNVQ